MANDLFVVLQSILNKWCENCTIAGNLRVFKRLGPQLRKCEFLYNELYSWFTADFAEYYCKNVDVGVHSLY